MWVARGKRGENWPRICKTLPAKYAANAINDAMTTGGHHKFAGNRCRSCQRRVLARATPGDSRIRERLGPDVVYRHTSLSSRSKHRRGQWPCCSLATDPAVRTARALNKRDISRQTRSAAAKCDINRRSRFICEINRRFVSICRPRDARVSL